MQCINTAVVNSNFRKKTTLSYILKVMFVVILSEPITWRRSWMVKFIELANICYVLWSCGVVEFHYYIPYPSLPCLPPVCVTADVWCRYSCSSGVTLQ